MQNAIEQFFSAWSETDSESRKSTIDGALASSATYSDPRSGSRLSGVDAISEYVGHFSANAPGWSATVDSVDEVNGYAKAIVSFGGPGPDGDRISQQGTYFVEADESGTVVALAGFVGA